MIRCGRRRRRSRCPRRGRRRRRAVHGDRHAAPRPRPDSRGRPDRGAGPPEPPTSHDPSRAGRRMTRRTREVVRAHLRRGRCGDVGGLPSTGAAQRGRPGSAGDVGGSQWRSRHPSGPPSTPRARSAAGAASVSWAARRGSPRSQHGSDARRYRCRRGRMRSDRERGVGGVRRKRQRDQATPAATAAAVITPPTANRTVVRRRTPGRRLLIGVLLRVRAARR
jgi:hypothetical protein